MKRQASKHVALCRQPARSRSFTLIELIVVIAIIFALLALTVGVTVTLRRKSEIRETENILRLLDAALQDWETSAERQLTWGQGGQPLGSSRYDLDSTATGEDQMSQLLKKLSGSTSSKQLLAQINQDYFIKKPAQGSQPERLLIKDAWGKEIVVLHPGRLFNSAIDPPSARRDGDGTIRTTADPALTPTPSPDVNEDRLGICVNRRICFVSFGPDLFPGDLQLGVTNPASRNQVDVHRADDNLTSYPLLRENPTS